MALPEEVAELGISERDWAKTPVSVRTAMLMLIAKARRVDELERRVRQLEEQLKTDSHNSSKPPSSDPPNLKNRRKRQRQSRKRRPGGQPGHEA